MAIFLFLHSSVHFTAIQIGGLVLWVLVMRLSTIDTAEIELLLAQSVVNALHAAQLTQKDAAAYMRIDIKQLGRQLRGEPMQHLSLTKLVRLPFVFWLSFGPALMYLVAKKRYDEIAEEVENIKRRA